MREYIALDVHKYYSLLEREAIDDRQYRQIRVNHKRGAIRSSLNRIEPGTAVAVEYHPQKTGCHPFNASPCRLPQSLHPTLLPQVV